MPAQERSNQRRFAERRHLRRQARMLQLGHPPIDRPARRPVSFRAHVSLTTPARLEAAALVLVLPRTRLVGHVLDWFTAQPELIQSLVVGRLNRDRQADFTVMVLRRLLRP